MGINGINTLKESKVISHLYEVNNPENIPRVGETRTTVCGITHKVPVKESIGDVVCFDCETKYAEKYPK